MASEILSLFLKWVIPFACGGIITLLTTILKNTKHKNEQLEARNFAIGEGVQCLLRAEIIRVHDKSTNNGFCPIYVKEALKRAYTAYHNLGGNDIATKLYEDVMKLPEDKE